MRPQPTTLAVVILSIAACASQGGGKGGKQPLMTCEQHCALIQEECHGYPPGKCEDWCSGFLAVANDTEECRAIFSELFDCRQSMNVRVCRAELTHEEGAAYYDSRCLPIATKAADRCERR